MVRIENPIPGKRGEIGLAAAYAMIDKGDAVPSASMDGMLLMIRLTGRKVNTASEYDQIERTFFGSQETRHIPIVNADKMIREVKSSRNWSYSAGVDHVQRQNENNNHSLANNGTARHMSARALEGI